MNLLPNSEIQKELSEAYVNAVVFRKGFNMSIPKNDRGIDGTIHDDSRRGVNRVDFQLKATTRYEVIDENIVYDLDKDNYNELIKNKDIPRVLILFIMPDDQEQWLCHSRDELCLRKCAYWVSLVGKDPSRNKSTVRVRVPMGNIFSPNGLIDMFNQLT